MFNKRHYNISKYIYQNGVEMATSVKELEGFLKNLDLKYTTKENGSIVVLSGTDEATQGTFIKQKEDGEMFSLETNIYDKNDKMIKIASDNPHKMAIYEYILNKSFTLKFGSWEVDSDDGEIKFAVEFPIEDATLTQKQFNRIISIVIGKNATEMFAEVRRVISTGSEKASTSDEIAELQRKIDALKNANTQIEGI